ncbi:MAG TPA: septum site-determining protein MinC [Steroidobacteraceae bacterium]|nr:septum site-determining protein MinC [Steroidobacteraceae bacterium]
MPNTKKTGLLMKQPANAAREQAVEVRFGQVGILQVRLHTTDPGSIVDELTGKTATAPHFFERTPVCLDLSSLPKMPPAEEIRSVIEVIRRAGMMTVGLAHGGTAVDELATDLELPVIHHVRASTKTAPIVQAAPASAPAAAPPEVPAPEPGALPALLQHQPVRSGQRVYARNRDLIVLTPVAAGAEVMADGCVHIYGPLRGRVMAGAHGDTDARVFCQAFHAELVSIAGVFRVFETIPPELAGMPVQAWLAGDDLKFAKIGALEP